MAEWKLTLAGFAEIFDGNPEDDEAKARLIVRKLDRVKNQHFPDDTQLEGIIEEFNIFGNEDGRPYFDLIMEGLYDWADRVRVWIEPRSRPRPTTNLRVNRKDES